MATQTPNPKILSNRLEGKVAIVTGGGSGFGEAISKRFSEEGCKVIVADLDVRFLRVDSPSLLIWVVLWFYAQRDMVGEIWGGNGCLRDMVLEFGNTD